VKDYLRLPFRLEIVPDDGVFVVRYPELPGCITQVEHREDVLPAAQDILEGWLALALEDNQTIPLPREDQ
jgi:predicted RNase H-like HicB family nuclease